MSVTEVIMIEDVNETKKSSLLKKKWKTIYEVMSDDYFRKKLGFLIIIVGKMLVTS